MIKISPREFFLISAPPFFVYIASLIFYSLWPEVAFYYQLDSPLHFLGGISIAITMFIFAGVLEKNQLINFRNQLIKLLAIFTSVVTAAVLWECYEFASDILRQTNFQPSVWDVMKDLILGALGGFLTATGLVWRSKQSC